MSSSESTTKNDESSNPPPTNDELKTMIDEKIKDLGGDVAVVGSNEVTRDEFQEASEFQGSRPGYVFKNGPFGTGYYVDKAGELGKRLAQLEKKLGTTQETAVAAKLEHQSNAPSAAVPEGERIEVHFADPKWGITARLSGGPVVLTKIKDDGEAHRIGLQVGDELLTINGINVIENRSVALIELRKGGEATCVFVRAARPQEVLAAAGGVVPEVAQTTTIDGEVIAPQEMAQLQTMLGNSKGKSTIVVGNKCGLTETIIDGKFDNSATLVFVNCKDCVYTLENYTMKIYVQDCSNFTLHANAKVLTSTMEIFKGSNCNLAINTDIGTLQADQVDGLKVTYQSESNFTMAVWAGCDPIELGFANSEQKVSSGFTAVVAEYKDADLNKERTQFKISMVDGKLLQERIIRLENGFTTTMREKIKFDSNQEATLQAMAKNMGITIRPGKKGIKVKPNDPCPCGSGKKFKKCVCFSADGYYKSDGLQAGSSVLQE